MRKISLFILLVTISTLTACAAKKELRPGEAEWLEVVVQAEKIVQAGATDRASCNQLGKIYSQAETRFKTLLPNLTPFEIRSRDMRMGVIKEFRDKDCKR